MIAARFDSVPLSSRSLSSTSSPRDQDPAGHFDDVLANELKVKNDGRKEKQPELKNSPSLAILSEWISFQSEKGESFDEKVQSESAPNQGQDGNHMRHENGQNNLNGASGHVSQFSSSSSIFSHLSANDEGEDRQIEPQGNFQPSAVRQIAQSDTSSNSAGLDNSDLFEPGLVEIRHVSHATHFSVSGDPIRQISQNVMSLVGGGDLVPALAGQNERSSSPVKVLNVLLEPESLGSVTLRMKLSGNQLSIRVEVAERSTLEMIRQDQDRLQQSLKSNEVELERFEIRAASPDVSNALLQSEGASRSDGDRRAGSDLLSSEGKARDDRQKQDQDRKTSHAPNQTGDDSLPYRGGLYL